MLDLIQRFIAFIWRIIKRFFTAPFRKLRSWLRGMNPVRRLWRSVKSKVTRATNKQLAQWVATYIGSALASTYLVTGLTTPASLANPAQIMSVVERTGIVNVLTGGFGAPIVEGVKGGVGDFVSTLGGMMYNDEWIEFGSSLKESSENYFEQGLGAFDDAGDWVTDNVSPVTDWLAGIGDALFGGGSGIGSGIGSGDTVDIEPANPDSGGTSPGGGGAVDVPEGVVAHTNEDGLVWTEFDEDLYPNYYRIIDEPVETDVSVRAGEISYGGIDSLGRTRRVVANVTYDMVKESAGWRCDFASDADDISGWGHNGEVELTLSDGSVYHGWFWNRSHLIADSLGGYDHVYNQYGVIDQKASRSERRNLITGIRTENVGRNDGKGGMAYFENLAIDYLEAHQSCSVWYSVEPVYEGDELVPRSVIVKIKSCDGGLSVMAEVYNQLDPKLDENGVSHQRYVIDYSTGRVLDRKTNKYIDEQ